MASSRAPSFQRRSCLSAPPKTTKVMSSLRLDVVGQLQGEHVHQAVEKNRHVAGLSGPFDLGPDDDFLAEAEEARFLGDDLVFELGPRNLELVLGVEDGVFEVLSLEFGDDFDDGLDVTFFLVFHGTQPFVYASACSSTPAGRSEGRWTSASRGPGRSGS